MRTIPIQPLREPWRPQRLLSAPHRLGFAVGAAAMSLLAIWWLLVLLAPRFDLVLPWVVAPTLAHGLLFTLGFMPAFMVGFLFTAGPRWLGMPPVEARTLLAPLLQFGIEEYIGANIGREFTQFLLADMADVYADSTPFTPVIFVLLPLLRTRGNRRRSAF